ncbi:uncharacterized protein F4822DRAFT_431658 [Hypoxylon trugodes]|uniref:uncharacterized protein n=1 Tax=Hypoxylon trugodes TaxID=326681 RepID=UPI00219C1562|nr:uncharacterized protein F4822DRAFT_431658 [Hypoxylon trugodes]KAI1386791.1 hypothetical protein F4822DRAFT_431658 [Hypoxylon trugodes]
MPSANWASNSLYDPNGTIWDISETYFLIQITNNSYLLEDEAKFLHDYYSGAKPKVYLARQRRNNGSIVQISKFATFRGHYICFTVNTEVTNPPMKARNVLATSYKFIHGNLNTLDNVFYYDVVNLDVRSAIRNAFKTIDRYDDTGLYHINTGERGWVEVRKNNPFILGMEKLLEENSEGIGNAFINMVVFYIEASQGGLINWKDCTIHLEINLSR